MSNSETTTAGSATAANPASILRKRGTVANENIHRKRPLVSFQTDDDNEMPAKRINRAESESAPKREGQDYDGYDSDDAFGTIAASGDDTSSCNNNNKKKGRKRSRPTREDRDHLDDEAPNRNKDPLHFTGEEEGNDKHETSLMDQSSSDFPVEPFNLNQEREGGDGYFDGDTYVFRKQQEEADAWLDGLEAGEEQPVAELRPSRDRDRTSGDPKESRSKEEIAFELAGMLMPDETVIVALRRYGEILRREKKTGRTGKKGIYGGSNGNKHGKRGPSNKEKSAAEVAVSRITDLADSFMRRGDVDVYDRKQVDFWNLAGISASNAGEEPKDKNYFGDENANQAQAGQDNSKQTAPRKELCQWEYRGNEDHKLHGPFSTEQMHGWTQMGFFTGDHAVDVRKIQNKNDDVVPVCEQKEPVETDVEDLMNDLLDDDDDEEEKPPTNKEQDEWLRSDVVDFTSYL